MTCKHLVTGATGFVGSSLVMELLDKTEDEIVCLVRSTGRASAAERLTAALGAAAEAYDLAHVLPAAGQRCTAVDGDLTLSACGTTAETVGKIDCLWHCAASLQYEDKHREAIWATNVQGTENVVDLARRLGNPRLVYVSTAYVAGGSHGDVLEAPVANGVRHNNWYERSKCAAEMIVRESGLSDWRIVRPGIVIGHSQTLQATSVTGMYGFIRRLRYFDDRVGAELGSFLRFHALRFLAEPGCSLNLIPIDAVASGLMQIGLATGARDRYFHLTNTTPPSVGDSMRVVCSDLGLAPPQFAHSAAQLSAIEQRLNSELEFYGSYLRNSKRFDVAAARVHIAAENLAWTLTPPVLQRYVRWYLEQLEETSARVAA